VVKKTIVADHDDLLPQSPKVVSDKSKELGEKSTIKGGRKMELMSFTRTEVDVMQEAKV
ncbi:hypothetical protein IGI04_030154, partial [Brassica rapa subsp. trilocularis]